MDPKDMLGVLLNMTDSQQKAIAGLLGELKGEVSKLKKAAEAVQQGAVQVKGSAQAVDGAVRDVLPALTQAAGTGASMGVVGSMEMTAKAAADALEKANGPVLDRLTGVVEAAGQAEGTLRQAAAWFSWKFMVLATGTTAAGMLALWALASVYVQWQRSDIEALAARRQVLTAEVAQLQANAEDWAKKGGRTKLERCGEQARLCVRVDTGQVYGKERDIRYVLKGY
jgi:hypothetical protein